VDFLPMGQGAPEHAIPVELPAAVAFSMRLAAVAPLLHHARVPQRI
jgi:hypothetical protein